MKYFTLGFIALLATLPAHGADPIAIGYVDMRKVLIESKDGQRVKADLEKTFKQHQAALAKEEEKLKSLEQAYEKEKLILSEAQRQQKQKEYQQKLEAYQKSVGEAQREIAQKENDFRKKAQPEVLAIVRDLAKEEKLTLVFEKHEVPALYAVDGPDLTDKVMARYNKLQK